MLRFRLFAILGMALMTLALISCGGDADDEPTDCCGPTGAGSPSVVKVVGTTNFGSILTTADGLTLYTFTQDGPGKSPCSGACAATWPPLISTETTAPKLTNAQGEFSLVARDDGSKQVAFNGKPLYRYAADKAAGEYTGEGVGGAWFVAKASGGSAVSSGTPSASPSASTDTGPVVY